MSLGRAPQPGGWLRYRRPFEGFENLQKVIDWLRQLKKLPYICVFPGPTGHWYWSLRYSLEGERGYALWGDQVPWSDKGEEVKSGKVLDELSCLPSSKSSNLVGTYEDGHFVIVRNAIQSLNADGAGVRPLVGLFYAKRPVSQYLGFGLVMDFTLDAYRNFGRDRDYWDEIEGAWVLRWRMRVLWLDRDVVDLLLKASGPEDFEKGLPAGL